MKFMDRFRKQKISDDTPETEGDEVSPGGHAMSENDDVQRKQRLLLGGVALIALVGGAWWVLDSSVSEEELASRRAAWTPPEPKATRGYNWMFTKHIQQADKGCDFDYLETSFGKTAPEPDIY